jgi:hypothetical protein
MARCRRHTATSASAQVSHEIGRAMASPWETSISARATSIGHTGNLNAIQTGTCPRASRRSSAAASIPELGDVFVQTNTGRSNYHGMTVELERRYDGHIGFHGSYTLFAVRTNVDSLAQPRRHPGRTCDIDSEMARSRQDVRHRVRR